MKTLFAVAFCVLATFRAEAQLHVLRTTTPWRMADTSGAGMLASTTFLGEFQLGFGSLGGDQAWNIKIGGMVELYRWRRTSLLFTAASELTANPYNDLGFNPRTASWEEQLFLAADNWQAGVFHRCKHEIDNTDPPNADTPTIGYRPTKRVLILSGIAASWKSPALEPISNTELFSTLRAEWYALHNDYRNPVNNEGRSWENMRGSLMAGVVWNAPVDTTFIPYMRLWGAGMLFAGEDDVSAGVAFNARAEVGFALQGRARMEFFVAWERLFDEPASVVPAPTSVVFVGARLK